MKRMKWMDKETIEEILFGESHLTKMNRYMQTLRSSKVRCSGPGQYCLRAIKQPANPEPNLGYLPSGGGPT